MALLPPNHIALPVAALYVVASILQEATNRDPEAPDGPGPYIGHRPYARRRMSLPVRPVIHSLTATTVSVVPAGGPDRLDPLYFGVSIRFRDVDGRPFYSARDPSFSPHQIAELALILRQPVLGCLSRKRIRENLNSTGLVKAFAPVPEDLELNIQSFEESAVARYRQALAMGYLKAVLFSRDGCSTPIPAGYWRLDKARSALLEPALLSIDIDGQTVRGHACVDLVHLQENWCQAFGLLPPSSLMAEAVIGPAQIPAIGPTGDGISPSVLLDFVQFAARKLGIVDSRGPDGKVIMASRLEGALAHLWGEYDDLKDVEASGYKLKAMVTLLRATDAVNGGQRQDWSLLGAHPPEPERVQANQ